MPRSDRTAAILVAAGRGLRAGAGGPKQYRTVGGQTVIYRAMQAFCDHPQVFAVQPVLNPDDSAMFGEAVRGLRHEAPVAGGDSAANSPMAAETSPRFSLARRLARASSLWSATRSERRSVDHSVPMRRSITAQARLHRRSAPQLTRMEQI